MKLPLTPIRCLLRAAQEYPDKVGIVDGDKRITYAQFWDRSARLASALAGLGVGPGDRVASLSFNSSELLELYYGVPMARAILLSLNVRLSPEEQAYILEHSGSKLVVFDPEFLPLAESLHESLPALRWLPLSDFEGAPSWCESTSYAKLVQSSAPMDVDFTTYDEDAVAELFYTSGSTGRPKGVMLSHRTLYLHGLGVMTAGLRTPGPLRGDQKVELHTIPLFHANGWGRPHSLTMSGGRHVMVKRFEPETVCRLIERERATAFSAVPTMATAMIHFPDREKFDLTSLEEITLGGAASTPALVAAVQEAFNCQCQSGYGLTESGPVASTAHLKDGLGEMDETESLRRQASTGTAVPGCEMRVVGPDGADVPRDGKSVGEILIRGDNVMDGYWNEPEATAAVMEGAWLHTGDMAVWDEQRYFLIVDRKKDIIISGGENISSLEIERVIAAHPAVYENAVIGAPHEKWGETPIALVTLKPGAAASEDDIREHVRAHLAGFKVPTSVEFRDELPKGATGKILKRVLREVYWEGREKAVHGAG